jgi:xylulokinase
MALRPPRFVLAIDLGTGGPKVALVSTDGEIAAHEFEPTPLLHTPDGGVEQSPEDWWSAVVAAARRLLAREAPAELAAVAVTGQWASTVPVGADGVTLGNALSWLDSRGAPHVRRIAGGRLRVAGYGPRELARWMRLTGGAPSLSGRDPVGHMLFLKHERPDVYRAARAFLEPVDYLTLRLTGRIATAPETATVHWATDTRDLGRVGYDQRLLALTGLDGAKLPEIVPTGSVVGPVTAAAAEALGMDPVPVIAATPDIMSAAVGSGAVLDGAAHLYVGTSGWLSCHVAFKRTDVLHSIAALPSSIPGRYLVCTEQQTAGAALAHLRDRLLASSGTTYEELLAEAGREPAGAGGVLFTPWLNGERTPVENHLLRAAYANVSLATTRASLTRATLEGVALNARWMHGHVERFVRGRLDDIALVGGGARSALWCRIFADVLGRTVRQMADPMHANVRGAALLAGVALGDVGVADIPARVPAAATFAPDRATGPTYDALFSELRRFYRANRRMYARLNGRAPASTPVPQEQP